MGHQLGKLATGGALTVTGAVSFRTCGSGYVLHETRGWSVDGIRRRDEQDSLLEA